MNARTHISLRDQIIAHLAAHGEATADEIARAIGLTNTPSKVTNELNAMRCDAIIESERKGKTGAHHYWLSVPAEQAAATPTSIVPRPTTAFDDYPPGIHPGTRKAQIWKALANGEKLSASDLCTKVGCAKGALDPALAELFRAGTLWRERPTPTSAYVYFRGSGTPQPQPAVGENTGSDGSGPSTTPEAVAIPQKPQPDPAGHSLPAPAAWDVSGDAYQEADDEMPTAAGNAYLTPEMQYLAPEDYELPDPDPVLLASANRMLAERLAGVAHVLRGSGLPGLAEIDDGEDLQPHVAALAGAYQMACAEPGMLRRELAKADAELTEAAESLARILLEGSDIDPSDMDLGELVTEAGNQLARLRALVANHAPTDPSYPPLPTYSAGKYQTRVGSLFVMQPDDTIFSELTTTVRLADEAAGEFVEVEQAGRTDLGKIAICRDEWPALRQAIDMMIAHYREAK